MEKKFLCFSYFFTLFFFPNTELSNQIFFFFPFIQVDECENLPKNMCDSCIIQLNVAYNLKKNAIQSDLKLRQYMIEFGMSVTSYTACTVNTVSVIRPPAMLMPTSTTSESVTITTAKSTTVGPAPVSIPPQQTQVHQHQQQQQKQQKQLQSPQPPPPPPPLLVHRPFPVMPVIIKEEPVDYEVMSDITVETNAEAFEQNRNGHLHTNGIRSTISSTSSSSNKSLTPLPTHSMVSINPVNSKSLLMSTQTASDSEYLSAYILTPSSNSDQTTKTTSTKSMAKRTNPGAISLAIPKSKQQKQKSKSSTTTSTPSPLASPLQQIVQRDKNTSVDANESRKNSPSMKRSREVERLFDDSLIQNKSLNESTGRQTRQKLKTVEQNMNGQPKNQQQQQPRSRSRNSTSKIDYKTFFSMRDLKRRLSMDGSISRQNAKKIANAKAIVNKMKSPKLTANGKRGSSISHNRARI